MFNGFNRWKDVEVLPLLITILIKTKDNDDVNADKQRNVGYINLTCGGGVEL